MTDPIVEKIVEKLYGGDGDVEPRSVSLDRGTLDIGLSDWDWSSLIVSTAHETTGSWGPGYVSGTSSSLVGIDWDTAPAPGDWEQLRGVGRTTLMLMDAAERKSVGLPVRIVVSVEREIDEMLYGNPALDDCQMTRGDFLTLRSATSGMGLRGHERSSVFVDHHVWEVGAPSYLDKLRTELQSLG